MLDDVDPEILAAREKLRGKFESGNAKLGGTRRKKKTAHKASGSDDKKVQQMLKKMQLSQIPGFEEVLMVHQDGKCLHFTNPKVQAAPQANTYVVAGDAEEKPFDAVMPNPLFDPSKVPPELIRQIQDQLAAASLSASKEEEGSGSDDDEVPDLADGETFERSGEVD